MGAGRRTSTYDVDTRSIAFQGFEAMQRKLEDKLGGCIFGCTNETFEECVNDQVFGLPRVHWLYVQNITTGLPIFLYNYQTKRLHGIFKAVSDGQLDIKPDGWCKGEGTRTQYPAQVAVEVYADCEALTDREYKPILKDCMMNDGTGKFAFELKKSEAQALCRAFDEKTKRLPTRPSSSSEPAERTVFRPASPPAQPAWGATTAKAAQEVPKDSDFPTLPGSQLRQSSVEHNDELRQAIQASLESERAKAAEAAAKRQKEVEAEERRAQEEARAAEAKAAAKAQEQAKAAAKAQEEAKAAAAAKSRQNAKANESKAQLASQRTSEPSRSNNNGGPGGSESMRRADSSGRNASPAPAAEQVQQRAKQAAVPNMTANQSENGPARHHAQTNGTAHSEQAGQGKRPSKAPTGSPAKQPRLSEEAAQQAAAARKAQQEAAAESKDQEMQSQIQLVHNTIQRIDPRSADALTALLTSIKTDLRKATEERLLLAREAHTLRNEKNRLTEIVRAQSHALEVFKIESIALRSDAVFIGKYCQIEVAPENPSVNQLVIPDLDNPMGVSGRNPETAAETQPDGESLHVQEVEDEAPVGTSEQSVKPQLPPTEDSLLIFGGNNSSIWIPDVNEFVPRKSSWTQRSLMPEPRGYGAAAAAGDSVYLMGGGTGKKWFNTCLKYDYKDEAWFAMSDMEEQRGSLGAASIGDRVYAVGGGRPGYQSSSMEILDVTKNLWMPGKHMKSKRFAINAGVINQSLFVIGGFSESSYLASGERHDPREGFWDQLPEMKYRRGGYAMMTVDTDLYVLGGWNNDEFMNSVEVYDARANAWREFPALKTAHAYFSAAQLDGKMYVMGGMCDQKNFNDLVEYYDESAGKWKAVLDLKVGQQMGTRRAFIASCKI